MCKIRNLTFATIVYFLKKTCFELLVKTCVYVLIDWMALKFLFWSYKAFQIHKEIILLTFAPGSVPLIVSLEPSPSVSDSFYKFFKFQVSSYFCREKFLA